MFDPAEQDTGVSGGPANNEEYGEQAQMPQTQADASRPVSPKATADAFRALAARLNGVPHAVQPPANEQPQVHDGGAADGPGLADGHVMPAETVEQHAAAAASHDSEPAPYAPTEDVHAEAYEPHVATDQPTLDADPASVEYAEGFDAGQGLAAGAAEVSEVPPAPGYDEAGPVPFEDAGVVPDMQPDACTVEVAAGEQPQFDAPFEADQPAAPVQDAYAQQAGEPLADAVNVELAAAEYDPSAEGVVDPSEPSAEVPGAEASHDVSASAQGVTTDDATAYVEDPQQPAPAQPAEYPVNTEIASEEAPLTAAVHDGAAIDALTGAPAEPETASNEAEAADQPLDSEDDFEIEFAVPASLPDTEVTGETLQSDPAPDEAAAPEIPLVDQTLETAEASAGDADDTDELAAIKEMLRNVGTSQGISPSEIAPDAQMPEVDQEPAQQADAGEPLTQDAEPQQHIVDADTPAVVDYPVSTVIEIDFDEDELEVDGTAAGQSEHLADSDEGSTSAFADADAPTAPQAVVTEQAAELEPGEGAMPGAPEDTQVQQDDTDASHAAEPESAQQEACQAAEPEPQDRQPEAIDPPLEVDETEHRQEVDQACAAAEIADPDATAEVETVQPEVVGETDTGTAEALDCVDAAELTALPDTPAEMAEEAEATAIVDLEQTSQTAADAADSPDEESHVETAADSDAEDIAVAEAEDDGAGEQDGPVEHSDDAAHPATAESEPETIVEADAGQQTGELTDIMSSIAAKFSAEPTEATPDLAEQAVDPENVFLEPVEAGVDLEFDEANTDPEAGEAARTLLDIMSKPSGASQPQERALAADTLLRLVTKIPVVNLIGLSERICMMEQPPALLVNKLIRHPDTRVAGPILETCNAIADQVLMPLIARTDDEKRRMIARRRNLSPALCDALLEYGDASVLLTIVRNPGATLSHDAFNILSEHAKTQPSLQAPLVTRGDTPAPTAFELFWFLPSELRRYVLSRFLTDSETLDKILKIALAVDTSVDINDQAEAKFPERDVVEEIVCLIEEGTANDAAEKLAAAAGINQANALRIISDPDGEPLSVAMKAMGLSRNQFLDAMQRWQNSANCLLKSDRPTVELQNLFDSLSFNKARVLLTYWDWAALESGPYARKAA